MWNSLHHFSWKRKPALADTPGVMLLKKRTPLQSANILPSTFKHKKILLMKINASCLSMHKKRTCRAAQEGRKAIAPHISQSFCFTYRTPHWAEGPEPCSCAVQACTGLQVLICRSPEAENLPFHQSSPVNIPTWAQLDSLLSCRLWDAFCLKVQESFMYLVFFPTWGINESSFNLLSLLK